MLKAILFDLDDTMLDWSGFSGEWRQHEEQRLRGVHNYLQERLFKTPNFETLVETYMINTREGWAAARSNLRAPNMVHIIRQTLEQLGVLDDGFDMNQCLEHYGWGPIPGVSVFPDVPPMLKQFSDLGIRLGIVTNASQPMWMRDREIEQYDLLRYFPSCRFSAADAGYLKPHPSIFKQAMDCLGTSPEETIFVGDNPVADIAGAQAAGMRAVLRVKNPPPPLISGLIVPDRAINTFYELTDVLDDWFPGWNRRVS